MDTLTAFGLTAVILMLVFYSLEAKSHWFTFAFAVSCGLGSIYGFLQGAWPFGFVECVWTIVVLRKWFKIRKTGSPARRKKQAPKTLVKNSQFPCCPRL